MNNRDVTIIWMLLAIAVIFFAIHYNYWAEPSKPQTERELPAFTVSMNDIREYNEPDAAYTECEIELTVNEIEDEVAAEMYCDSLELLACCVQAEAGNQPFEGKQLVVDVILNRVASPDFPDNIEEVIRQSGQFSVVSNGSINRVVPTMDTWSAVLSEVNGDRLNGEVVYFRAGGFSGYGTPWKQVGAHYFSTK